MKLNLGNEIKTWAHAADMRSGIRKSFEGVKMRGGLLIRLEMSFGAVQHRLGWGLAAIIREDVFF